MRVILITGASSGIGAAAARLLAAPDTALALHARKNREGLEKVAKAAQGAGAQTHIVEGDLAAPGTPLRLIEETARKFGRFDVLIANAGFADRRLVADREPAAGEDEQGEPDDRLGGRASRFAIGDPPSSAHGS